MSRDYIMCITRVCICISLLSSKATFSNFQREMKYDVTLSLHPGASWKEKRASFWCPFINTPSVQAHHPLGKQWLGQKLTVASAHALPSQPSVFAQIHAPGASLMIHNEGLSDLLTPQTLTSIKRNISCLPLLCSIWNKHKRNYRWKYGC